MASISTRPPQPRHLDPVCEKQNQRNRDRKCNEHTDRAEPEGALLEKGDWNRRLSYST